MPGAVVIAAGPSCAAALPCARPPAGRAPSTSSAFMGAGGAALGRRAAAAARPRGAAARPPPRRVARMGLFGLGAPELAVIAGVVALIYGPAKLPELGRGLGKTVKSFQGAAKEFEKELKDAVADDGDEPKRVGDGGAQQQQQEEAKK